MNLPLLTNEEINRVADVKDIDKKRLPVTISVAINCLHAIDENDQPVLCNINQDVTYVCLPWKPLILPSQADNIFKKQRKNQKISLKNIPLNVPIGTLFSIRYSGMTRGMKRTSSLSGASLKNSVSVDLVLSENQYVNVKISSWKLHLSGVKSDEQCEIAGNYILSKLYEIDDMIRYCKTHPVELDMALEYCKKELYGEVYSKQKTTVRLYRFSKQDYMEARRKGTNSTILVEVEKEGVICTEEIPLLQLRQMQKEHVSYNVNRRADKRIIIIQNENDICKKISLRKIKPVMNFPSHIDPICFKYLTLNAWTEYEDDYDAWLEEAIWLSECRNVFDYRPTLDIFKKALVNHNFGLGFPINRKIMAELFEKHPHFIADFDNSIRNSNVKIQLPYHSTSNEICRKDKKSSVIIIVYLTGKVTMIGPLFSINRAAFLEFISYIREIRPLIEVVK